MKRQAIRLLLKTLKIISIAVISLIVLLFVAIKVFWFVDRLPRYSEKETNLFIKYKSDYETVNSYIIKHFDVLPGEDEKKVLDFKKIMNRYSNENYSAWDCQCPHRDTCPRYGYRENDCREQRQERGCRENERRQRRGNGGCLCFCNLFRRCGH